MNKLLDGLRLGASAKTVALADLSAEQLMSNLSDEQKAALAAELAPKADEGGKPAADQPSGADDDKGTDDKGKKKKKEEEDDGGKAGADAADPNHPQYAAGFAAACKRSADVAASEHYAGREKAAAKLLGNPKLSASEIIETLADLPKGGEGNMLNALKGDENPDLGAGAEATTEAKKEASSSWDRTFERMGWKK